MTSSARGHWFLPPSGRGTDRSLSILGRSAWDAESSDLAPDADAAVSVVLGVTPEVEASLGALALDPEPYASAPQRPWS